ncbi:hypothetical protein NMS_2048 [Nonlabens marinus S1-08]|uniref:Uncharacterized protein n=2 Tax=Nonlabens TaxID=363408 RepID=W8VXJ9_9FLAO|nr:hypothetical protein NMS_2048 [Nonlabens marinus S1-08]
MKQTTLLIFIVFAFILNSCGQNNSKTESIENSELINIVGTKVLFPKSSFTESKKIVGLVNANDAMILVTELLNDSFESQAKNLNKAFIERSGGEILDTKQYLIDGFNAKQLIVKSADSLKIRMVLFGDNEFCTFLTAKHFLNDEKSEKEIEFLLENVKYDKSIVVNPLALSPFIIDGNYNGFKHFTKSQNTHFYTRDGNERKNREKDPSLAIVYGVLRNESDFEKTFKELTSLNDVDKFKTERNGQDAYEGVFNLENGNKRYYLLLKNDLNYIMIRGTAMEEHEQTIADFKNFADQVKWKK